MGAVTKKKFGPILGLGDFRELEMIRKRSKVFHRKFLLGNQPKSVAIEYFIDKGIIFVLIK